MAAPEKITYSTTCKCGTQVPVFQDAEDRSLFHFECTNCGVSVEIRQTTPFVDPGKEEQT